MKLVLSVLAAGLSLAIFAGPAHAETETELYDAVEGLKQDNLFLFPTATVALEAELKESLEGSGTAVVVIPADASMDSFDEIVKGTEDSDGYEYDNFADAVLDYVEDAGYSTVIVLSTNRNEVASEGYAGGIEELIEGSDAGNTQKIVLARSEIIDEATPSDDTWILFVFGAIFGTVLMLFLAAVFGESIWDWFMDRMYSIRDFFSRKKGARKARKQAKQAEKAREKAQAEVEKQEEEDRKNNPLNKPTPKDVPKSLRKQLEELRVWTVDNILPLDPCFAKDIELMLERFNIFHERLHERSDAQNQKLALLEYEDMLSKINNALSEKYYLDILKHPELWDDPEERISQVKRAVEGVKYQLLENIKQVNGSRDLDFQASLESLAGFMEAPKVKDLYS